MATAAERMRAQRERVRRGLRRLTIDVNEGDLQAIKTCVDGGDAADRWEEWEHWDSSFHQRLVAATHNRLAIAVYQAIVAVRHERPWLKLKQGHTDPVRWREYQDDHRQIADALLARDAVAATAAIRSHLVKVRAKMLGPAHRATAESLANLATLLNEEGDLVGARTYYERALGTFEMVSPEHPRTNRLRYDFARLLLATGSAAEGLTLSETALGGHEKILGRNHRWTKDSAEVTADVLTALGRADEALALRQRYGFEPHTRPVA